MAERGVERAEAMHDAGMNAERIKSVLLRAGVRRDRIGAIALMIKQAQSDAWTHGRDSMVDDIVMMTRHKTLGLTPVVTSNPYEVK